jgi:hypothetical protein
MQCNGTCSKYSVKKIIPRNVGHYESGHKRCSICEIFIIWDGKKCPCCSCKLRSKPRSMKGKDRLVQSIKIE